MSGIEPNTWVVVTDAEGDEYRVEALTGIEQGHKFPIVWVNRPLFQGGFDPMPWPAESVRTEGSKP